MLLWRKNTFLVLSGPCFSIALSFETSCSSLEYGIPSPIIFGGACFIDMVNVLHITMHVRTSCCIAWINLIQYSLVILVYGNKYQNEGHIMDLNPLHKYLLLRNPLERFFTQSSVFSSLLSFYDPSSPYGDFQRPIVSLYVSTSYFNMSLHPNNRWLIYTRGMVMFPGRE